MGRLSLELPRNGSWREMVRYRQKDQRTGKRKPIDLTSYHAFLQARATEDAVDALFTISTRSADVPDLLLDALDESGEIAWTLDLTSFDLPDNAVFELLLIDPAGAPMPIWEGQLQFTDGIARP